MFNCIVRVASWLLRYPLWFIKWRIVWRHDDVREVLSQDKVFEVLRADDIKKFNGGPNFLLGMNDRGKDDPQKEGDLYRRYYRHVTQAFNREDIERIVKPGAARLSEEILASCGNEFDAIEQLIARVPVRMCRDYYGVPIDEEMEVPFANWTIAVSKYLFGSPPINWVLKGQEKSAFEAGERVRCKINHAIDLALITGGTPNTVLSRLVAMHGRNDANAPTKEEMRAYLIGMITGYVPTNAIGAGNILDVLLQHKDMMAKTRAAALNNDEDLLWRCLFEALRFKPLPGHFRVAAKEYTIAAGTWRATKVKRGTKLFACTQAAMMDSRGVDKPTEFNPSRPRSDYLTFGHGMHWCVGAYIAQAQTTQIFKALLKRGRPERVADPRGHLQTNGIYPLHLFVSLAASGSRP